MKKRVGRLMEGEGEREGGREGSRGQKREEKVGERNIATPHTLSLSQCPTSIINENSFEDLLIKTSK